MKTALEVIVESLENYSSYKKYTSTHIMIKCPFHRDNTPSLGVFVTPGMEIPLGSFHCFGCSAKGSWNALAEKLNFPKIKEWETKFTGSSVQKTVVRHSTVSQIVESMGVGSIDWPKDVEWRSIGGGVLNSIGAKLIEDARFNTVALLLPVYVNKKLVGAVKAALKKEEGELPYVTTAGEWVKEYGLFLYDYAPKLNKYYVVLVEGPRDALRLYSSGIPAIAILGSQNFCAKKALLLSALCSDVLVVLPDNDPAGKSMKTLVKKHCSPLIKTISICLPEDVSDPFDLTDDGIEDLKNILDNL